MKYLRQIGLIFLFSLLGELCRFFIPLPIPASVYGMILLFAALMLKLIRLPDVQDAGSFMTSVLPVLFVAPTVNLISCWDIIKDSLWGIVIVVVITTVVTFAVAGVVTQLLIRRKGGSHA